MKFNGVDALAPSIEGMQSRRIPIREAAILEDSRRAECSTGGSQLGGSGSGAFALHGFPQRKIGGKEVVVRQRRCLIGNCMGGGSMFHCGLARPKAPTLLAVRS